MSRKPIPDTADADYAAAPHPLPSEGGSYVVESGALRQVETPTADENPNAPAAPSTEA